MAGKMSFVFFPSALLPFCSSSSSLLLFFVFPSALLRLHHRSPPVVLSFSAARLQGEATSIFHLLLALGSAIENRNGKGELVKFFCWFSSCLVIAQHVGGSCLSLISWVDGNRNRRFSFFSMFSAVHSSEQGHPPVSYSSHSFASVRTGLNPLFFLSFLSKSNSSSKFFCSFLWLRQQEQTRRAAPFFSFGFTGKKSRRGAILERNNDESRWGSWRIVKKMNLTSHFEILERSFEIEKDLMLVGL